MRLKDSRPGRRIDPRPTACIHFIHRMIGASAPKILPRWDRFGLMDNA
jgi:hypothetical protein